VLIGGTDVTALPPERRNVAMVFEYNELLPFLDVAGNLGLGLTLRHRPQAEIDERVRAQARGLRISRLLPRRPATLSAGERAQVGIGRALIRVPSVFLLDEPLAHHDAASRIEMRRHIAEVVRSVGATTLYVTHDQSEALAVADRIAVLDAGRVVQVARPRDIYAAPTNLFVATSVGSVPIGLLPAELVSSGGTAGFRVGARVLPLWAPVPSELRDYVGRQVVLGIRPEHVRDAAELSSAHLATLPATVTRLEYTGADTILTIAVAAPAVAAPGASTSDLQAGTAQLRARFPGRTLARVGALVQVSVDVARAHVFDPGTGVALHHLAAPDAR
jgi:multiple sugar transport system ATP-binding protein